MGERANGPTLVIVLCIYFGWIALWWGTALWLILEKGWSAWWLLMAAIVTIG